VEGRSHVVEDGHRLEQARGLEGARHAGLRDAEGRFAAEEALAETDLPLARRVHPGDQIEDRRLPGPVGPDQAEELTLVDRQVQESTAFRPPK